MRLLGLALLLAAAGTPDHRLFRQPNMARGGGDTAALFEFASPDGGGMGAACACGDLQGNRGETVTTSRTGTAICSKKGLTLTGIAPGDFVACAANKPRVEPDGEGYLGLRKEYTPANRILRSQALDNAGVWTASDVTVTANTDVGPDGTTTAETLEDTSAANVGYLEQANADTTTGLHTGSCLVKAGTLTAGSLSLATAGGSGTATCAFSGMTSTYTRVVCPVTFAGSPTGHTIRVNMGANAAAVGTLIVTDCQLNVGALKSVIPTTASAVALGYEATSVPYPTAFNQRGCAKLMFTPGFDGANGGAGFYIGAPVPNNDRLLYRQGGAPTKLGAYNDAVDITTDVAVPYAYGTAVVIKGVFGAVNATLTGGAGTVTAAWVGTTPGNNLHLGSHVSVASAEGIVSRFVVDPDSARCN